MRCQLPASIFRLFVRRQPNLISAVGRRNKFNIELVECRSFSIVHNIVKQNLLDVKNHRLMLSNEYRDVRTCYRLEDSQQSSKGPLPVFVISSALWIFILSLFGMESLKAGEETQRQEGLADTSDTKDGKKKSRVGFHDRKMIEYENRIRDYSTPDKIFRYFATLKVYREQTSEWEVLMTPEDFVRSLTPGMKQPEGLGLDQFKKFDPKVGSLEREQLECDLPADSIFYKLGQDGLMSFSDYIFLLVILSTPPRVFEIAFKMFDLNGDGNLDAEEFQKVHSVISNQTSIGKRHRDNVTTGNTVKPISSALTVYFFGADGKQQLTVQKFLDFQKQLETELLLLEFNRYGPENGRISEVDFATSLLTYAGLSNKRRSKMLKKVKKTFADKFQGVSFKEYMDFYDVLNCINDIDTALMFYNIAGASIDKDTLRHVAMTVAHVALSNHIIDVVFTIFDENDDGTLSNKEFVSIMKHRMLRGLKKPKDTGFIKLMDAVWKCMKYQTPSILE